MTLDLEPGTAQAAPAQAPTAAEIGPLTGVARADRARQLRITAADFQRSQTLPAHPDNGDEARYATRIASYSKALPHNSLGEPSTTAYAQLLTALTSGLAADFEAITLGGTRELSNPQAAYHYTLEGADSHALTMPAAPLFSSVEAAGEMGEVYWMALARDVYFGDYGTNATTTAAVTDLNRFSDFRGPKPASAANLFRGTSPGCLTGPYVSQFLYLEVPEGVQRTVQQNRVPTAGTTNDFMTGYTEWLNIQKGVAPTRTTAYDGTRRFIRNGRDLAEYVHLDYPYQTALNAANIVVYALNGLAYDGDPSSARAAMMPAIPTWATRGRAAS